MKFREHRGSLADSMATEAEVADHATLVAHIAALFVDMPVTVTAEALHVAPYAFDKRTGWNTHLVTLDDYGVVGFTDGPCEP